MHESESGEEVILEEDSNDSQSELENTSKLYSRQIKTLKNKLKEKTLRVNELKESL